MRLTVSNGENALPRLDAFADSYLPSSHRKLILYWLSPIAHLYGIFSIVLLSPLHNDVHLLPINYITIDICFISLFIINNHFCRYMLASPSSPTDLLAVATCLPRPTMPCHSDLLASCSSSYNRHTHRKEHDLQNHLETENYEIRTL